MRSRLVLSVLLVMASLLPTPVSAGDAPDRTIAWRRRSSLRDRADRYMKTLVTPVIQRDPRCSGEGVRRYVVRDARGRVTGERSEECPSCGGTGKVIRWAVIDSRLAYYTPAFRARAELVAQVKAQADRWYAGTDPEPRVEKYRIEDVTLVGDRYGLVRYTENGIAHPKETRWVELPGGGGKEASWCLYSEEVDGPWGGAESPPGGPAEPPPPKSIEGAALVDLAQRAAVAGVKHTVTGARWADGLLVVTLFLPGATDAASLAAAVRGDVVAMTRTAMKFEPAPDSVRLEFLGRWRDRFGAVAKRPVETASIDREVFDKIVFDNLSAGELLALWTREVKTYDGEVPWWKD